MGSNVVLAKDGPINAGAQLLATELPIRKSFNCGAILSRNTSASNPLLNGLIPAHTKRLGGSYRPPKLIYGTGDKVFGFHATDFRQEKLASQDAALEILALTKLACRPRLRAMNETIHERIRRLREKKGYSMMELAKQCGIKSWQAVQQWENGETAPKRDRLKMVAKALGVTESYLITGIEDEGLDLEQKPEPGPSSARDIAMALRITVQAISERWGISIADLTDGSNASMSRVEAAIAARLPLKNSSAPPAEEGPDSAPRQTPPSPHEYNPPGAGFRLDDESEPPPSEKDGSEEG